MKTSVWLMTGSKTMQTLWWLSLGSLKCSSRVLVRAARRISRRMGIRGNGPIDLGLTQRPCLIKRELFLDARLEGFKDRTPLLLLCARRNGVKGRFLHDSNPEPLMSA